MAERLGGGREEGDWGARRGQAQRALSARPRASSAGKTEVLEGLAREVGGRHAPGGVLEKVTWPLCRWKLPESRKPADSRNPHRI